MGGYGLPLPWVVISISKVCFVLFSLQLKLLPSFTFGCLSPWTKAVWLSCNPDKVGKEESFEQMSKFVAAPSVESVCLQAVKLAYSSLNHFNVIIFSLLEIQLLIFF